VTVCWTSKIRALLSCLSLVEPPKTNLTLGAASLFSAVSDLGSLLISEGGDRETGQSQTIRPHPLCPQRGPSGRVVRTYEELADDNFMLPHVTIANRLVDAFFRYATLYAPYIPEAQFRETLSIYYRERQKHARPINKKRVAWLALLNLVFAFGCDYIDLPLCKLYALAQMFAGRANELIHSVAFETVTLEVLQAQLLMSIHLLTDMQLNRCWANIGSLLRAAQALGLHLDPSDWNISPLEKELRKRLWWGIYWLDRYESQSTWLSGPDLSARSTAGLLLLLRHQPISLACQLIRRTCL